MILFLSMSEQPALPSQGWLLQASSGTVKHPTHPPPSPTIKQSVSIYFKPLVHDCCTVKEMRQGAGYF